MKQRLVFGIAVLLPAILLVSGMSLWALAVGSGGEITVCVGDGGSLRLIEGRVKPVGCTKTLTWNVAGPQGPQGERGPAGPGLHVQDANGQDLGLMVSGLAATYLPQLDLFADFNDGHPPQFQPWMGTEIYFAQPDCGGPAYLDAGRIYSSRSTRSIWAGNPDVFGRFQVPHDAQKLTITARSQPSGDGGFSCRNISRDYLVYPLEPVTLPFTEPLGWPIRIVEQ